MSLLDTASLLLTPNAYKEGKLYSVIPSDGSGDFTFTRATTATRVNSDGLVELVPYNLLGYTEDFSNAYWRKISSSITSNSILAPNGTTTADTLTGNASTSYLFANTPISVNGNNIFSIYVKAGTLTSFSLFFASTSYAYGGSSIINLTNGTASAITYYGGASGWTVNVESADNGWYRCSIGGNIPTSTSMYPEMQLAVGNVYVWGAQLVQGSNALPYQKTETRLNIPRLDYSLGGCPNILLEPQRTNLALQSSSFDSASWSKVAVSVTANTTTSPSGIQDADTITTSSTSNAVFQEFSVLASTTYTFSWYVLRGTMTDLLYTIYNISGSSFIVDNTSYYSQTSSTNWERIIVTFTTPVGCTSIRIFPIRNTGSLGNCFLWGAQLEQGAYATSYIPTTTASVTRNVDICSKTGATSLIGQTEGTLYAEFNLTNLIGDRTILEIGADNSNRIRLRINGNTISASIVLAGSAVGTITFNSQPLGNYKFAYAYKQNDFQAYLNGNAGTAVTSGNIPSSMSIIGVGTRIVLGADVFSDSISTAALWKERLTNAQLAQLTTI